MNITQQMQEAEQIEQIKDTTIDANVGPKFLTETFLNPARLTDETQEHYRMRQKANKLYLKFKKKGQLLWLSKDLKNMLKGSTFDKAKYIEAVRRFEEAQAKQKTETNNTQI